MPRCRPSPDNSSNRTAIELKAPRNCWRAVVSGKAATKYWSLHHDGASLNVDLGKQAFDRHAAMLNGGGLSRSANGIRRASIVRKLQRDHGKRFDARLKNERSAMAGHRCDAENPG